MDILEDRVRTHRSVLGADYDGGLQEEEEVGRSVLLFMAVITASMPFLVWHLRLDTIESRGVPLLWFWCSFCRWCPIYALAWK
jgi:hypothetical protein